MQIDSDDEDVESISINNNENAEEIESLLEENRSSTPESKKSTEQKGSCNNVKKRKTSDADPVGSEILKYIECKRRNNKNKATSSENDEFTNFMLSCVPTIKRLPPAKQAWVKVKISTLLMEAEFGMNVNSQCLRTATHFCI